MNVGESHNALSLSPWSERRNFFFFAKKEEQKINETNFFAV